jgi:NAD(P)-dependent dehydrogenase (short-subunit alcohol dehydrogenase family)
MTDIAGRAAVVTGGGSGIGMGLARELARQGARVAIADIVLENAQAVAEGIVAEGGKAIAIQCDVCERASLARMRDEATAALGPVTLVVANAGATNFDRLVEMSDEDVDWIVQVNLMGTINTIRAFLKDMIDAGGGHILATSSMAGLLPAWIPVHSMYAAAKLGIIGLMMNLAHEVRPHGISTTTYCPGGVSSSMGARNQSYRPERFGGPTNEALKISADSNYANNPITLYSPEDIAPIVLNAVRNDRPFVFDHADQRRFFHETYVDVVDACYDDIDAYEAEHGIPTPVRVQSG